MKIYNTLTRKKETFTPVKEGEARIYACGPTVYNFFHIGNARPFIIFDTLRRYLEYKGYRVTFVQNFTDIDDKMINKANDEGITVKELADRFIGEYYTDAQALCIKPATHHPKATEHMDEIINLIQTLVDKGHAYLAGGDVYFDVSSFQGYGKLSGQSLEELMAGARVESSEQKKNPMDFALWKAKKENEPFWDSPFGQGRPGWHIECSAMSQKYLGDTFDIHGGGVDLIFPHHENEIAQSEAATGKPFANYWMHNGFINIDNKKMSKSLNNFFTVRDIAAEYDLLAVRMFMLSAHYRNPINFSRELIEQAKTALLRIHTCVENLTHIMNNGSQTQVPGVEEMLNTHVAKYMEMMDDDLNTAGAIGTIFELVKDINLTFEKSDSVAGAQLAHKTLCQLLDVLGLNKVDEEVPSRVKELLEERNQARSAKNWALSDQLRDEIASLGYAVKDTPGGAQLTKL